MAKAVVLEVLLTNPEGGAVVVRKHASGLRAALVEHRLEEHNVVGCYSRKLAPWHPL